MVYCSSDAWMGDSGFNSNAVGWSFRGQRIIEAVITDLAANFSLGTAAIGSPRVLLAGCAAGARGAMVNIGARAQRAHFRTFPHIFRSFSAPFFHVALSSDYLGSVMPAGVQLRGFFDSPLWMDLPPLDATTLPLINQTMSAALLVNATGRQGIVCGAQYTGIDAWKCLFGQFRLPTVHTQWLAAAPQFDVYQLPYDIGTAPPYEGAALSYANIFQRNVRSAAMQLPAQQQAGSAIYSSACFREHCTSTSGAFWGVKVDGISLKDYLGDWYYGGLLGNRPQVVEACSGFGCGQCSAAPAAVAPAPPLPPARAGLYAPPAPAPPPPSLSARLLGTPTPTGVGATEKRTGGLLTGDRVGGAIAALLLVAVVAIVLRIVAKRATRTLGSASGLEMRRAGEASPLLRTPGFAAAAAHAASAASRPRPGFSASPQLPPGIRVTKVAPLGRTLV